MSKQLLLTFILVIIFFPSNYGMRPLAIWSAQTKDISRLVGLGGDVNESCGVGETPLHDPCFENNTERVNVLLENKADPNREDNYSRENSGERNRLPLDYAIMWITDESIKIVDLLIGYGANPHLGPEGDTPLDRVKKSAFIDAKHRDPLVVIMESVSKDSTKKGMRAKPSSKLLT